MSTLRSQGSGRSLPESPVAAAESAVASDPRDAKNLNLDTAVNG
jgi:hypothetical protein